MDVAPAIWAVVLDAGIPFLLEIATMTRGRVLFSSVLALGVLCSYAKAGDAKLGLQMSHLSDLHLPPSVNLHACREQLTDHWIKQRSLVARTDFLLVNLGGTPPLIIEVAIEPVSSAQLEVLGFNPPAADTSSQRIVRSVGPTSDQIAATASHQAKGPVTRFFGIMELAGY